MLVSVHKYCSLTEYDNLYPYEIDVYNATKANYEDEIAEANIMAQTQQLRQVHGS